MLPNLGDDVGCSGHAMRDLNWLVPGLDYPLILLFSLR